jgi:hypothetical protein
MNIVDILAAKANVRAVFGWGGWSRAKVYDEDGNAISTADGLWIIALGNQGYLGLTSLTAAMFLPVLLFVKRYPAHLWWSPAVGPSSMFAVLICLYMIDNISNGMLNPLYTLAVGGLTGLVARPRATDRAPFSPQLFPRADQRPILESEDPPAAFQPGLCQVVDDPRQEQADFHKRSGRDFKDRGLLREAEMAWNRSLDLCAELVAAFPDSLELRKQWADCHNDLAWLLSNGPDPDLRDPARAISLARKAVDLMPECATYWNTLGAAYCRSRDCSAAVTALERSMELGSGGTGYDYVFLVMAHSQSRDVSQTTRWLDRADEWIAQHRPGNPDLLRFRSEALARLNGPSE